MAKDKARPGIVLYFSDFAAVADALDDASIGRLLRALMLYGQFGEVTEFDEPALRMAFGLYRPRIDADNAQYIGKVRHAAFMSYKATVKRSGLGEAVMDEDEWIAANYPENDLTGTYQEPGRHPISLHLNSNSFQLKTNTKTNIISNTNIPDDPEKRRNYFLDMFENEESR